jgi:probable rRNA maturation factor
VYRAAALGFEIIFERGQEGALNDRELGRRVRAICVALGISRKGGSIVFVGDDQIHQLNKTYRNKNKPTDVLAFAMQEGEFASVSPNVLGDVVVSVPTAAKQAARAAHPLMEEVTMLVTHGLLHLLGWDHDTDAKDVAMRTETERLCRLARAGTKKRSAAGKASLPAPKPVAKTLRRRPRS